MALSYMKPGENVKPLLANLSTLYRTCLKAMGKEFGKEYRLKYASNSLNIFDGAIGLEPYMDDIRLFTKEALTIGLTMDLEMEGEIVQDKISNKSYILSKNGVAYSNVHSEARTRVGRWLPLEETVVPLLEASVGFEGSASIMERFKTDYNIDVVVPNGQIFDTLEIPSLGRTWYYQFPDAMAKELPLIPVSGAFTPSKVEQLSKENEAYLMQHETDEEFTEHSINDAKSLFKGFKVERIKNCGKILFAWCVFIFFLEYIYSTFY